MHELLLRYFGIVALIGCGIFFRKRFSFQSEGIALGRLLTSALFPAYVFGSLVGLDSLTLSFASGIRIAIWSFAAASLTFFLYRKFFPDPYPFVAASRNFRSLGIPLLYFRFYDSILQEVAVFAVLGMAVFESFASAYSAPDKKGETTFAKTFFIAFALGAAAYFSGISGWIDYSWLNLGALLGKGIAGYAYSVLSLFFIGFAIAPAFELSKWKGEFRSALPVLVSQVLVWPCVTSALLLADAAFWSPATGGIPEIGQALLLLSFMPASITSAAVCARVWQTTPAKWVALSIGVFLAYCPLLLGDSFSAPALSVLDSAETGVQSP